MNASEIILNGREKVAEGNIDLTADIIKISSHIESSGNLTLMTEGTIDITGGAQAENIFIKGMGMSLPVVTITGGAIEAEKNIEFSDLRTLTATDVNVFAESDLIIKTWEKLKLKVV